MARDFNGSTQYIQYGNAWNPNGSAATWAGWVWFDSVTAATRVIFSIGASGSTSSWAVLTTSTGAGRIQLQRVTSSTSMICRSVSSTVSAGAWLHLAATTASLTGTDNHLYLNGVEVSYDSRSNGTGTENEHTGNYTLGANATPTPSFDGRLAHPGLWDRVLSADEIAGLAAGYTPDHYPRGLRFGPDLIGPVRDSWGGQAGTIGGSAPLVEHPRMIEVEDDQLIIPSSAAPPATIVGRNLIYGEKLNRLSLVG